MMASFGMVVSAGSENIEGTFITMYNELNLLKHLLLH